MRIIGVDTIHDNPYAAEGMGAVNLYNIGDGKGLTFGQLVLAVCIQRGAAIEKRAVLKANELTQTTGLLKALSESTKELLSDTVFSLNLSRINLEACRYTPVRCEALPTIYDFFTVELGLTLTAGANVSSYNTKMETFKQISPLIEKYAKMSEQLAIDLQSQVNSRDVAYNTSSTILNNILKNVANVAGNF